MEIRDILYGAIPIRDCEKSIVDSDAVQRLRNIRQLGFADQSFPSATHSRYVHSLGAMHVSELCFRSIFINVLREKDFERILQVLRLSCLLHDVGHGPLSHSCEFAMPMVEELFPELKGSTKNRKANHEDYTRKFLMDSELTYLVRKVGLEFGFNEKHLLHIMSGSNGGDDFPECHDFFSVPLNGRSIDLSPILHQLISGELDCDRMDYLRRDSHFTGVSYGQFDFDWICSSLTYYDRDNRAYLALNHRALYAFEDFLLSRFHMFLMVYLHYKSVIYDEMLGQYLKSSNCDYHIPSHINAYQNCTDTELFSHLKNSKNEWAVRITRKNPLKRLLEIHSSTGRAADEELFQSLQDQLTKQGVFFIASTSIGELSQLETHLKYPTYVKYDNHFQAPIFIELDQCTDLFKNYQKTRTIKRLYVDERTYDKLKK